MTREQAIKWLSRYVGNDGYTDEYQEVCRMAIAALREQDSNANQHVSNTSNALGGWISVKDRLPESEKTVLIYCRSQFSQWKYVCCGFYVPEGTYREDSGYTWDFECCDKYDEEKDDYQVRSGWYEAIHNWDDYSAVGVSDIVTHWMPLPEELKEEV